MVNVCDSRNARPATFRVDTPVRRSKKVKLETAPQWSNDYEGYPRQSCIGETRQFEQAVLSKDSATREAEEAHTTGGLVLMRASRGTPTAGMMVSDGRTDVKPELTVS